MANPDINDKTKAKSDIKNGTKTEDPNQMNGNKNDKQLNGNTKDKKKVSKKKTSVSKEEKAQQRLRKLIKAESKRITKVIVPISICMLLVIISIQLFPIFSNGINRQIFSMVLIKIFKL